MSRPISLGRDSLAASSCPRAWNVNIMSVIVDSSDRSLPAVDPVEPWLYLTSCFQSHKPSLLHARACKLVCLISKIRAGNRGRFYFSATDRKLASNLAVDLVFALGADTSTCRRQKAHSAGSGFAARSGGQLCGSDVASPIHRTGLHDICHVKERNCSILPTISNASRVN